MSSTYDIHFGKLVGLSKTSADSMPGKDVEGGTTLSIIYISLVKENPIEHELYGIRVGCSCPIPSIVNAK
jgi:hypothetical protein